MVEVSEWLSEQVSCGWGDAELMNRWVSCVSMLRKLL